MRAIGGARRLGALSESVREGDETDDGSSLRALGD